ncbi:MAG: hypothetical protein ACJ75H_19750 [Thermoanaerobaculia bacterium]
MSPCRRRSARTLVTLAALLLPVAAAPANAAAAPAKPQDLHGSWRLNEDVTARMRENQGEARPGGRMGPPGGMRPQGGGIGGRGRGPGGPGGMIPPFNEITIEQTAETVTFTDGADHKRVLWTDNRKVRETEGPGGPAEVRARWDQNGSLVVQVTPDQGPKHTETWLVSNDRKLLYLTVEMESEGRPGFKVRRAYDAIPAGEAKKKTEPPPAG